jgi:uncharacterized membrane-anchored protein YjiN (DUF445 family)
VIPADVLLEAALTVAFGSLAGGLTNTVAIWMLFHPYEPPRVRGRAVRWLQGAIPKNRERLARAMGRTVGERLLTGDDLARALAEPAFRDAFDERLDHFVHAALERERGSLRELLPTPVLEELQPFLDELTDTGLDRLTRYLESDAFEALVHRWVREFMDEIRDRPVADLLTEEREEAMTGLAHRLIAEAVGGRGFESAVRDYLERAGDRLLAPGRTFEELLPIGLVAAVEKAIAGYLPLAIERLATLLEDPEAREKLKGVLIPPDTVERVIRAMETEGAANLSELLHDDAVRDAMARSVNDAIVDFLRRPVPAVLGRPGDDSVEQVKDTVTDWVLGVARDPGTREFLVDKLRSTLGAAEDRTWGDVLGRIPPDRLADGLVAAARSDEARRVYGEAADRALGLLMDRPIGRPADFLGEDSAHRTAGALREPLWQWLQDQVPAVAQRVDVAGKVEQKILDYPMVKVEELVRGVTERELQLIVYLGYVLGAVIGFTLVGVQLLF